MQVDQSIALLQSGSEFSYLESLLETGENLLDHGQVLVRDGYPTESIKKDLEELYAKINLEDFEAEEIRQAFQLALIKGMREDYVQVNHQMTPDSIASFIAYLIEVLTDPGVDLSLGDLSIGTGNLIWTIHHFLNKDGRKIHVTGVDNDELLISLASMLSALQDIQAQLVHGDSLQNLLIDPVDVMVSDLPVGYYPLDQQAQKFETANREGHSYSHHLLIEQAFHYLKDGGFAYLIVPYNLFESQAGKDLLQFIQKHGYLQGMIHLNKAMFQNEVARKSIVILQKQSENSKQAEEVLLATAPEFNQAEAMKDFLADIHLWYQEEFK